MKPNKNEHTADNNRGASQESHLGTKEPSKLIRFISLNGEGAIENFDIIRNSIRTRGFAVDFSEFKFTNTKVQKRLIQPNKKDGPRERIEIEEKIDVNSHFKYLRQVSWKVLKEPHNVFLVQMNQVKGMPCSLPLIFPDFFQAKYPVLVTGTTDLIRTQLIAKPDLAFASVADPIAKHPTLRKKILERAERERTMQAIAREMKDFFGLPEPIKEKLNKLAVGEKVPLSDEEAINIILISDLFSRYQSLFQSFERDIANRSQAVAALASQFADMTQGIPTDHLLEVFKDYLVDDQGQKDSFHCETNGQLFAYLYQRAQVIEEKRIRVGDRPITRSEMFAIMRSMITLARSQIDPGLWHQCLYFYKHDDSQALRHENFKTIDYLLETTYARLKVYQSASTLSLLEIHLIHNIHRIVTGKAMQLTPADLSKLEQEMIRSAVVPIIYQPDSATAQTGTIQLKLDEKANLQQLINPVHTVGRVYGFLMGRRLRENVQQFLKPGLKDLLARFGKNFFSIFYEMAVQEAGLPISQNQFAEWLQQKQFFEKPEQFGYLVNDLETFFDPNLTPEILMETGRSCFPITYSETQFSNDFENARHTFHEFLNNMHKDGKGFAKVLDDFLANGTYKLRSKAFKTYFKKQALYKTLVEVYIQASLDISPKLLELAVNNKLVLKTPLDFDPMLLLENMFLLNVKQQTIQVHLIAIPVKSEAELESVSAVFSQNLRILLKKAATPQHKELLRALRIIKIYQAVYLDFLKQLLISILDRQITHTLLKLKQQDDLTANHIRYHFETYEKLLIGNPKGRNLSNLMPLETGNKPKAAIEALSHAQMLQASVLFKSATHKLRDYRSTIDRIRSRLEHLPGYQADEAALAYSKQLQKFKQLLSTPIEELNENVLKLIGLLAQKIDAGVTQGQTKKGAIANLYSLWKTLNPTASGKIDFYRPFLRQDDNSLEQKLFLEIAKTRELLQIIKRGRCLIVLPETQQESQFQQLLEVGRFIVDREFDGFIFVEISELNDEQIEHLAQVFYPGNFFRLDQLKPIPLQR